MAEGLIAPEYQRLLRMARQAQDRGLKTASEELGVKAYETKYLTPELGSQMAMDTRNAQMLNQGKLAAKDAAENLAGRIAFADELKQRAGDQNQPEGFDLRQFAEPRAAALKISPAALSSFFARNKLAMNGIPKTTAPTEVATTASNPLVNLGIPGVSSIPLKSQQEIDLENKKALAKKAQETTTPRYGGTYGSTGFYQ